MSAPTSQANLKRLTSDEDAFTLIELLVVILIIGILIAVAAPSFLGQVDKAHDSNMKQTMALAYKSAKASSVDRPAQGNWTDTSDANGLEDLSPGTPDGRPDHKANSGALGYVDPEGNPWTTETRHPVAGDFDEQDLVRQIIRSEPQMHLTNLGDEASVPLTENPDTEAIAALGQLDAGAMYIAVTCTPGSCNSGQVLHIYGRSASNKIWKVQAPANGALGQFQNVTP